MCEQNVEVETEKVLWPCNTREILRWKFDSVHDVVTVVCECELESGQLLL